MNDYDNIPQFESEGDAYEWMSKKVDDSCVDNHRFAYEDDPAGLSEYEEQRNNGCCGFFDKRIMINGRFATIGCNYGH